MATVKWATPTAIATALTTDLNTLANGSFSAVSAEYDNETNQYLYGEFELHLASLTPSSGGYCALYLVKKIDGTNYEDGGGAVTPPSTALVASFPLRATAAAQHVVVGNVLLPNCPFKMIVENRSGVSFAGSGNTLKYRFYGETVA